MDVAAAPPTPPGDKAKAKGLLDQADKEFTARRYAEAGRLYEQCSQADPAVLADAKERWAYCKLYGVVEAYKHAPAGGPAPPEWERDVRLALSMAPDNKALGVFAGDLLNKLQDRRGPTVRAAAEDGPADLEIRHTRAPGGPSLGRRRDRQLPHLP